MSRPVVLVTASTVSERAQQILRDGGCDIVFMKLPIGEADLIEQFAQREVAAILLRGSPPFTARVIEAGKSGRIMSKHGVGYDSVDVPAATKAGVAVMMANGGNADPVAEHSLALMLATTREIGLYQHALRSGRWKEMSYNVRDFSDRTVGIVGYGQIGRRTARLVAACGAKVVIFSRRKGEAPAGMEWETDFDRLLERVDILSLHCPLTDQTRGMVGARELGKLRKGAIVINTSRGQVIDEAALIEALKSGHLAGAGLDTFAQEPVSPDNPLLHMPNVICTPHIAASTTGAMAQLGTIASNNIVSYLKGEVFDEDNFVNPEVFAKR